MADIYVSVGTRICNARKEKNVSQEDLANYLQIARPTLANWEKGRRDPSLEMLKKISFYLNVTTDYLLGMPTTVSSIEETLLKHFRALNEEGQEKLLEQAEFFVSSGKYIKNNESNMVQAK